MSGLIRDTLNELIDRKIIWVFAFLALVAVGAVALANQGAVRIEAQGATVMDRGQAAEVVDGFVAPLIDGYLGFVLLIAVFGTAGLIPRMFEKGRAEYYLAQPLSRTSLLLSKICSIWIVYGGLALGIGLIILLTVTVLRGAPDIAVLVVLGEKLLAFFVWLSIAAVMGIVTGSTGFTIITIFTLWIVQRLLPQREMLYQLVDNRFVEYLGNFLYYVLPKFSELSSAAVDLAKGNSPATWLPIWSTALFGVAMVLLALILFKRKDY